MIYCEFRVLAENAQGIGVPSDSPKAVKISMVPSAPNHISVTDATKSSILLAWSKPEYNGGSEVTG